jgi:hypothetical protein
MPKEPEEKADAERRWRMSRLAVRILVTVALTGAADYLLFGHTAGCGVSVFALMAAATVAWQRGARLGRAGVWIGLWLVVALGASYDESIFGRMVMVGLGWSILAMTLLPGAQGSSKPSLLDGIVRGLAGGLRSFSAGPSDVRRFILIGRRRFPGLVRPAWVFALPAALVLVFAALIVPANRVLARWTVEMFDWVWAFVSGLSLSRALFWTVTGLGVYGLFRFRLGRRRTWPAGSPRARGPRDEQARRNALTACLLSFAGLNALYLVANVVDVVYLWFSFELPAGMTLSQFAHQGAYRLIVAVVLAAATVTVFLPTGSSQLSHSKARALAYAFVVQNLVVLAGAARRLQFYVVDYGLTRFRVGVVLWLVLVAAGFVLIAIRIRGKRPVLFLFRTNAVTTVVLLATVALLNVDGLIAEWNVRRYEVTPARAGTGALPALARLVASAAGKGEPQTSLDARAVLEGRLAEEKARLGSWQSWTWRRRSAVREAERMLRDRGSLAHREPVRRPIARRAP